MKTYRYGELTEAEKHKICERGTVLTDTVIATVREIKAEVLKRGDEALKLFALKFDGATIENLKVSEDEIKEASESVDEELKTAINTAKDNIFKFHEAEIQNRQSEIIETTSGVYCYRKFAAINRVGLYIPGGSAPLFSTVLMTGIPAAVAGCKDIILCTPAGKDSKIAPEILYTASLLNIKNIYKIGGAQAIYAMAYGTETVPKVDKIFGPGNQYVTAAKTDITQICAIDMPAGPSEVLIIADKTSNPDAVASDILSQSEHGITSQTVLALSDEALLSEILSQVKKQAEILPRKDIILKSLENSFVVLTDSNEESVEFSNIYAPEHLILNIDEFENLVNLIENAGSVFCGKYASESFGDYASGTNHTLPTSGFAKSFSGLSVESFGKRITFQQITKTGFKNLARTVEIMAKEEGLDAHGNAVTIRRKYE